MITLNKALDELGQLRKKYCELQKQINTTPATPTPSDGAGIVVFPSRFQFRVGDTVDINGNLIMAEGDTVIRLNVPKIVFDSVEVFSDNGIVLRDVSEELSYGISYTDQSITITFNQEVVNRQKFVIRYDHT